MSYQVPSVHLDGTTMFDKGEYWGVDRYFDGAKGVHVKPDFVMIIKRAAQYAFSPLLIKNTRTLDTHACPQCKAPRGIIKLVKKPDLRNRIHACKECGYRKMTPGYVATNGPFVIA